MLNADQITAIVTDFDKSKPYESGMFAIVTNRRCGTKVAKVSADDPGYMAFLDLIDNSEESPIFPKIYAKHTDGNALFVVMEKLEPLRYDEQTILIEARSSKTYEYVLNMLGEQSEYLRQRAKEILPKESFDMLVTIRDHAKSLDKVDTDMHGDNVMLRVGVSGEPDSLVVTDPYYSKAYEKSLAEFCYGTYSNYSLYSRTDITW